ncbi:MAG: methyltransferase family protein [Steroidobacteraceae bacterium]
MAHAARLFVTACWIVLCLYWLIAARSAKKAVRTGPRWTGPWLRFALVVAVIVIVDVSFGTQRFAAARRIVLVRSPSLAVPGALLALAGVALAIWARVSIGRNWGMPMSLREGHELVTAGPYARLRHPIYSGILLTMLGSALAQGTGWLMALIIYGAYFVWSARIEERDMTGRFPTVYPAYRERTWMLVPFVL